MFAMNVQNNYALNALIALLFLNMYSRSLILKIPVALLLLLLMMFLLLLFGIITLYNIKIYLKWLKYKTARAKPLLYTVKNVNNYVISFFGFFITVFSYCPLAVN